MAAYEVIIWVSDDIRDEREPDVHGQIELDEAEYRALDDRLYGMEGEEFIVEYHLNPIEPLPTVTLDQMFEAITDSQDEEWNAAARAEWDKYPIS